MNFSYWEKKHFLKKTDFTIIGSGITGLTSAFFLRQKYPNKSIQILDRGMTPWGASTKNAGFACFGSISEILSDIEKVGLDKTIELVEKRWRGLFELRSLLGDDQIGLENNGGYELFTRKQKDLYSHCIDHIPQINSELKSIFKNEVFQEVDNQFGFQEVEGMIYTSFESQIDTGLMMKNLIELIKSQDIEILFGAEINAYEVSPEEVSLEMKGGMKISTERLLICTNGFASQFLKQDLKPARAQVLITKPIPNLKIKGTFHLEEGYYYFRNIDNRVLFGGGRNLDFKAEETTEMEVTTKIMDQLNWYLKNIILPNQEFEVDYNWAGIMGVGQDKNPIVEKINDRVYCGVRMGGMGVAIGTLVGKELASLVD